MKTELLENTGEFKDSDKVKGLLCHVNKSASRTAKSYGAIANFDQLRGFVCALSRKLVVYGLGSFSLERKVRKVSELCAWNIVQYSSLSRAELQRAPRAY